MPSPLKKSFAAEQLEKRKKKKPPVFLVVVILALIVVGYVFYLQYKSKEIPTETVAPEIKKPSVAVLPFDDMSAEQDQKWYCEGVAEGIINALTQVSGLHVAGRTSSFVLKDKGLSIPEIGKLLNVDAVLEGSIMKSGNQLLITAQLIKVSDGFHLWSEEYNRELKDVFDIRDDISLTVVDSLKIILLGEEKEAIVKRNTENTEAYELYMMGRFHWKKRTEEGFRIGLDYFKRAVGKDSTFSHAYVGIADSYNLMGVYGFISSPDALSNAKVAVDKALKLDNALSEAYSTRACIRLFHEFGWINIEEDFKKSIAIHPYNEDAHHWFGYFLSMNGRHEEAIKEAKMALEIDPLSPVMNRALGNVFYNARKYDQALEYYLKARELNPSSSTIPILLIYLYTVMDNYDKAIEELGKSRYSMLSDDEFKNVKETFRKSGFDDAIRQTLNYTKNRSDFMLLKAILFTYIGENELAIEALENNYEERRTIHSLKTIKVEPAFENLQSIPRFKALLKKLGLPES
ncbi:tetratricopeptide repeat protein [Candidatus Latescibacterota bacterium]